MADKRKRSYLVPLILCPTIRSIKTNIQDTSYITVPQIINMEKIGGTVIIAQSGINRTGTSEKSK